MAVVGVAIAPLGTGTASISPFIAACLRVLEGYEDLKWELTPMSTVIEGELGRVIEAVKDMHEVAFSSGALRVLTTITIDDRRDKSLTMKGKLDSVHRRLEER